MRKKGNINRYGWGVTIHSNDGDHYWWVPSLKKWLKTDDIPKNSGGHSSHYDPCRTIRAFERHLRKYCKDIKNAKIIWVQRQGSDASIDV